MTQLLKKTRHGLYEKIQERLEQTEITHKSVFGTGWQEVFIAVFLVKVASFECFRQSGDCQFISLFIYLFVSVAG